MHYEEKCPKSDVLTPPATNDQTSSARSNPLPLNILRRLLRFSCQCAYHTKHAVIAYSLFMIAGFVVGAVRFAVIGYAKQAMEWRLHEVIVYAFRYRAGVTILGGLLNAVTTLICSFVYCGLLRYLLPLVNWRARRMYFPSEADIIAKKELTEELAQSMRITEDMSRASGTDLPTISSIRTQRSTAQATSKRITNRARCELLTIHPLATPRSAACLILVSLLSSIISAVPRAFSLLLLFHNALLETTKLVRMPLDSHAPFPFRHRYDKSAHSFYSASLSVDATPTVLSDCRFVSAGGHAHFFTLSLTLFAVSTVCSE